jgi:uncharacterized membrane protein
MTKSVSARIEYLDYARGFAVFTMFLQHCMLVHEYNLGETSPLGIIFVALGTAPAAPVFLLLMGVFLARSKSSFTGMIKRGAIIVGLGYLLSLLRFTLPLLLSGETEFPAGESPVENLFAVDIFQTAGLSLMVGAVLRKCIPQKWILASLGIAIILAAPFLWKAEPVASPLNLLWGTAPQVYFPFFPWFYYPLIGMAVSEYVTDRSFITRHIRQILGISFGLALLGIPLLFITPMGDYLRSGAAVHLGILAFIFIWFLGLLRLEQTGFKHSRTARTLLFWSRNVTGIYFIQWVLFGWSMLLFGGNAQPDYIAAAIGFTILLMTHYLVKINWVRKLFP